MKVAAIFGTVFELLLSWSCGTGLTLVGDLVDGGLDLGVGGRVVMLDRLQVLGKLVDHRDT